MLAVTAKLPIISASPVYGKISIPVNPLPSPTNVPVVVPETFKFSVKVTSPVEHEYSKVFTRFLLYSSVHDTPGAPPKASAEVCVPAPANCCLAVIKAPPVDHDVPLYSSVHEYDTP